MRFLLCFFLIVPLLAKPTDDHTTKEPSGEDAVSSLKEEASTNDTSAKLEGDLKEETDRLSHAGESSKDIVIRLLNEITNSEETGNSTGRGQESERLATEFLELNQEERARLLGFNEDKEPTDFSSATRRLMAAASLKGEVFGQMFTDFFNDGKLRNRTTSRTTTDDFAAEIVGMGQKIRRIIIKILSLDTKAKGSFPNVHGWMILALPDSELRVAIKQLKLNMPLTVEKQLEEIKKQSPELHRKIVAYNEIVHREIENLSEEPRRYIIKKNEALYTPKKSKDGLEFVEAIYSALHDNNELTPEAKAEIASLPSKIGKTLKETLKKMFPNGPHAQADY